MSKFWREQQEECYQEIDSRMTSRTWACGLVTQLLEMTHRLWLKSCSIRHNRAEGKGTKIEERDRDVQIREQFTCGTDGLAPDNHWLLEEHSEERVLHCKPIDKLEWLGDVKIARKRETERRTSVIGRMQINMRAFLNQGEDDIT